MIRAPRLERVIPAWPDLSAERELWTQGWTVLAGLDEAGRGAWAGPVFAGAAVLPCAVDVQQRLNGVRDSKQMSPVQRLRWVEVVREVALGWGVGWAEAEEVDALGILPATRLAMTRALADCAARLPGGLVVQHLLVDALRLPQVELPQTPLIHGDARALSIAAASLLAKTSRDRWMASLEGQFPGYGFERNFGYGTALHRAGLDRQGICPQHRRSFAPIRRLVECQGAV